MKYKLTKQMLIKQIKEKHNMPHNNIIIKGIKINDFDEIEIDCQVL